MSYISKLEKNWIKVVRNVNNSLWQNKVSLTFLPFWPTRHVPLHPLPLTDCSFLLPAFFLADALGVTQPPECSEMTSTWDFLVFFLLLLGVFSTVCLWLVCLEFCSPLNCPLKTNGLIGWELIPRKKIETSEMVVNNHSYIHVINYWCILLLNVLVVAYFQGEEMG